MRALTSFFLFVLCLPLQAASLDTLKHFVAQTRSLQADFVQTISSAQGKKSSTSQGTLAIVRPGKFRWEYTKPYEQLIVGDGTYVWLYDPDLRQVTQKKLNQALGSSPAALLAGNDHLERDFVLTPQPARDGLEWLQATPRQKESSFQWVHLGFRGDLLEVIELQDQLDQRTVIRLSRLQKNPNLPAERFRFTPPANADVIRD